VLRLAVERTLADETMARRASELASWAAAHDPGDRAARLIERFADRG
jgi:UDP:flavonoid glycosyltransferase YjiC (YdhE family)